MRKLMMISLLVVAASLLGARSLASEKKESHLKTNFDFEDQIVQGKYQYPDEAVTTVEDEKLLTDLLSVRKDFKDRLKQEASRR